MSVQELQAGVHFRFGDSKMTELGSGVFISYDTLQHERAIELRQYLEKHFRITKDDFPYLFADYHVPYKVALEQWKQAKEKIQEEMRQYFLDKANSLENLQE